MFSKIAQLLTTCLLLLSLSGAEAETGSKEWGRAIHHDGDRGTNILHFELSTIEGDPLVGSLSIDMLGLEESKAGLRLKNF